MQAKKKWAVLKAYINQTRLLSKRKDKMINTFHNAVMENECIGQRWLCAKKQEKTKKEKPCVLTVVGCRY